MKFTPMQPVFPDQPLWGAHGGLYTFIISKDEDGYTASVKLAGLLPYQGQRHDLGGYCAHKNFAAAVEACEDWLRAHTQ